MVGVPDVLFFCSDADFSERLIPCIHNCRAEKGQHSHIKAANSVLALVAIPRGRVDLRNMSSPTSNRARTPTFLDDLCRIASYTRHQYDSPPGSWLSLAGVLYPGARVSGHDGFHGRALVTWSKR